MNQENKLPTAVQLLDSLVTEVVSINEETYKGTAIPYRQAISAMKQFKELHLSPLQTRIFELEKQVELRHKAYLESREELEKLRADKESLLVRVEELKEALADLYLLKQHKDKFGKDGHYIKLKLLVWLQAKEALKGHE